VFNRRGEPGIVKEWWYHLPSGTWFVAERDVVQDRFLRTYLYHTVEGQVTRDQGQTETKTNRNSETADSKQPTSPLALDSRPSTLDHSHD
jgi:sarcosine oxidase subunit delta